MKKFIKLAVLAVLAGLLSLRTQGAVAGKGNDNGAQFTTDGCGRVIIVLPNGNSVELPENVDASKFAGGL